MPSAHANDRSPKRSTSHPSCVRRMATSSASFRVHEIRGRLDTRRGGCPRRMPGNCVKTSTPRARTTHHRLNFSCAEHSVSAGCCHRFEQDPRLAPVVLPVCIQLEHVRAAKPLSVVEASPRRPPAEVVRQQWARPHPTRCLPFDPWNRQTDHEIPLSRDRSGSSRRRDGRRTWCAVDPLAHRWSLVESL
jgi:hypothetical protein